MPTAVEEVSKHAGGRPVHLVGWSLGGIFSLLTAADRRDLPIASVTVVGSPVDVSQVPLVAPLRPLLNFTEGRVLTPVYQLMGGAPKPLVKWAFQLSSFQKLITKPLAVATHLDDADFLAQIEAVDRFTANMIAYPGRSFGQLYHRFVRSNVLSTGRFELGRPHHRPRQRSPRPCSSSPAPPTASHRSTPSRRWCRCSPAAGEVRFEIVPGGHLGMLTGRAARGSTWRVLDEWVGQWSTSDDATPVAKKAATRKTAKKTAKKTTRKTAAKKSTPRKTPTSKPDSAPTTDVDADAIGVNPTRRYGSACSRSLAR